MALVKMTMGVFVFAVRMFAMCNHLVGNDDGLRETRTAVESEREKNGGDDVAAYAPEIYACSAPSNTIHQPPDTLSFTLSFYFYLSSHFLTASPPHLFHSPTPQKATILNRRFSLDRNDGALRVPNALKIARAYYMTSCVR